MSVFISDIDTTISVEFSFIKMLILYQYDWVATYESLKTKEKSSWVESFSLQSLSHSSNGVFTKVVLTRAGRLREWSQGELRL